MPGIDTAEQISASERIRAVDEEYEKLQRFHVDRRKIVFIEQKDPPEGGFGIVLCAELHQSAYLPAWLASRWYGPPQLVAVKQIKISKMYSMIRVKRAFTREMLVWSGLEEHPGIAKFLGFYADLKQSEAWLLSPWEPNGNVSDFIAEYNLEVPEKLSLIYDTIDALSFLHQLVPPVCHGDIKSNNVLVSAGFKARLCDFGLAQLHEDNSFKKLKTSTGPKGSIRWNSPEIINGAPRAPTSDVYAWAWLVWEIMTGNMPYEGTDKDYAIICKIFEGPLNQLDGASRLSDCLQVWDLMTRCWSVEPGERPTAKMCKTTITYLPRCTPTPANAEHQIRRVELLENLGDLEIWKGNLDKSFAYLDEALLLYQEEADSRGIASVLRKQAVAAYRQDDNDKAHDKAIAALELFRNLNDPLGIADASFWLGCSLTFQEKKEEALVLLDDSLKLYRAHENEVGAAHCLERIGEIQRVECEEEKALVTLGEAVEAASRSGDRLGEARALRTLGLTQADLFNFVEADAAYLAARAIAWSIGWQPGLINSLWLMVSTKMDLAEYDEAEELIRESISMAQQRGLLHVLASSLWDLGDCLERQSRFTEASAALEESCLLYQTLSDQRHSKQVASDLVELKRSRGEWDRAIIWQDHIIAVSRNQKDQLEVGHQLKRKGEILAEAQRHDEAALHMEAAIATYQENDHPWYSERERLCGIPKAFMKWELPLLCDIKKLQRRIPHLVTATLKLQVPTRGREP